MGRCGSIEGWSPCRGTCAAPACLVKDATAKRPLTREREGHADRCDTGLVIEGLCGEGDVPSSMGRVDGVRREREVSQGRFGRVTLRGDRERRSERHRRLTAIQVPLPGHVPQEGLIHSPDAAASPAGNREGPDPVASRVKGKRHPLELLVGMPQADLDLAEPGTAGRGLPVSWAVAVIVTVWGASRRRRVEARW